ncbi:aquaporin [Luteolibacter sp. GHJ8]|uniref:Aquaporin n=1 Tax=Luteolibacter rhizosphaerae TaxID=2989719 RepID=A0ABT3GA10_9BACT|nr:aquaporin [Luteolibacter rhizosphaerae]MCW1916336.1 aquaporin [Luteolibacter rhizosphaerae]
MKKLLAEFLATFALVFAGTGAIVVNQMSGGVIGHAGVAAVFGLIVLAMIHCFGSVSGAHMNPAVTLGFAVAGRFPWRETGGYILAQCAGAIAASLLVKFLFPASLTLGATLPAGSVQQSFVLELAMSALLMLVILRVSAEAEEKGTAASLAIAATVGLEAMFGGPVSGASMNPARSLGPALVSGHLAGLWIYLVATTAGALLAVPLCALMRAPGCCGKISTQS